MQIINIIFLDDINVLFYVFFPFYIENSVQLLNFLFELLNNLLQCTICPR